MIKVTPINHRQMSVTHQGFTLIEMMLVVVVIGIMATFVQFNTGGEKREELLKKASMRFAGVFEVAADYSMLNNIELGVLIEKNSYQFLAFDGERWTEVAENDLLTKTEMPEDVDIVLTLDDLPIDEDVLFDDELLEESGFTKGDEDAFDDDNASLLGLDEDDEDERGQTKSNKRTKKLIPQIYILSGGDISPFSVTFKLTEEMTQDFDFDEIPPAYRITGIYSIPLTIEGPVLDDE